MQHTPSPIEQLFIELINRARANPMGEAARQGTSLGTDVSAAPSQPLAFNDSLSAAAEGYSQTMLDGNFFAHVNTLTGETLTERVTKEGYSGNYFGENLAWQGSSHQGEPVEIVLSQHDGLWNSLGHRQNMMNATYSEIGVGVETGAFTSGGTTYPFSTMTTHNFGHANKTYLTGVVIDDADGDRFYDIGEGQGNVQITATGAAGSFTTQSYDSGGYSLELTPGDYTVTFSGGDLAGSVSAEITMAERNVKLDAFEQEAVETAPATAAAEASPEPLDLTQEAEAPQTATMETDACPYFEDMFNQSMTTGNSGWLRKTSFFERDFDADRFADAQADQLQNMWQDMEACWA